jgi:hypothetical protein
MQVVSDLRDIKDRAPSPELVAMLERNLERAKAGEIRSAVLVLGWDDDSTSHGWVLDFRSNRRMLLAETLISQQELALNIGLQDGTSVLSK